MKTNYLKNYILPLLLLLITTIGTAQTFTVDNINYNVISTSPNEVEVTGGTSFGASIVFPNQVTDNGITYTLTKIGRLAFRDKKGLTKITLPENLIAIGSEAFEDSGLVEVIALATVPAPVNNGTFRRRTALIDLTIPNGTEIAYANAGWTGFKTVNGDVLSFGASFTLNDLNYRVTGKNPNTVTITGGTVTGSLIIPESVTERGLTFQVTVIGFKAFLNETITSVSIPSGVTEIGKDAFRNTGLQEITSLNPNPPSLERDVFSDRQNIQLTVPTGAELNYLFNNRWKGFASINGENEDVFKEFEVGNIAYRITSVNPNEVTTLDNTNTGALIIPSVVNNGGQNYTVTSIGEGSFTDNQLTAVTIPNTVVSIGDSAFRDNQLKAIVIPNSVTTVGSAAFERNRITNITFSANMTSISGRMFQINRLETVIIPAHITTIGGKAFRQSPLKTVIIENPVPARINSASAANDSFGLRRDTVDLFVPIGTLQAYKEDILWAGFKSIAEVDPIIRVSLKAFLQGAALNPNTGEASLMRDDLDRNGLIPTTSPYSDTVTRVFQDAPNLIDFNNRIVDWVLVELRNATDNTLVIERQSALLQRDGDVVGVDGVSLLEFTSPIGSYFVSINHRNHLGIITASPVALSNSTTALDLSTNSSLIQGGNTALAEVSTGVFALISGDVDSNGLISISDINTLTPTIGNSGYSNSDLNMDSQVLFNDNVLINQNLGSGEQFSTAVDEVRSIK